MRSFFHTDAHPPESLLTQQGPTAVIFTGADAALRRQAVQNLALTAAGAGFHTVIIDGEGLLPKVERPGLAQFASRGEFTRVEMMRNALRIDPDLIAVDLLDAGLAAIFLQSQMTGHFLVAAMNAATPDEAHRSLQQWSEGLLDQLPVLFVDSAAEVVVRDRPAEVRPEPTVEELYRLGLRERPPRSKTLLEALSSALGPHRRVSWLPLLGEPEGEGSKFGGRPWLMRGETRPAGADGNPLLLVLQLEVAGLPAEARPLFAGKAWLQFFRSLDPRADQGSDSPANVVHTLGAGERILAEPVAIPGDEWTPRAITGWRPVDDYPHREDWPELGIALSDEDRLGMDIVERLRPADVDAILQGTARGQEVLAVIGEDWRHFGMTVESLPELRRFKDPHRGDKLLGWPAWEQGPEWPQDAGRRMEFLFQLEFDESYSPALPMLISSDGRGHLFRSVSDPARFAFPWACG